MATIINNPPASNNSNSTNPITLIIVLVVVGVLLYLGYVYGLPALQQMQSGKVQINVPNKIDVNVNKSE